MQPAMDQSESVVSGDEHHYASHLRLLDKLIDYSLAISALGSNVTPFLRGVRIRFIGHEHGQSVNG